MASCIKLLRVSILFILAQITTQGLQLKIEVLEKISYKDAEAACAGLGLQMVAPADSMDSFLSDMQYWVPMYRQDNRNWTWIDGTAYDAGVYLHHTGQDCAVMRTSDQFVDQENCHKRRFGFICTQPNSNGRKCPRGSSHMKVLQYDLCIYRGPATWYEAVNTCKRLGTHLFTFNESHSKQVIKQINRTIATHGHLWIGLSRNSYTNVPGGYYQWDVKGKQSVEHRCVTMALQSKLWRTTSCSRKYSAVCVGKVKPTTQPSTTPTSTTKSTTKSTIRRSKDIKTKITTTSSLKSSTPEFITKSKSYSVILTGLATTIPGRSEKANSQVDHQNKDVQAVHIIGKMIWEVKDWINIGVQAFIVLLVILVLICVMKTMGRIQRLAGQVLKQNGGTIEEMVMLNPGGKE